MHNVIFIIYICIKRCLQKNATRAFSEQWKKKRARTCVYVCVYLCVYVYMYVRFYRTLSLSGGVCFCWGRGTCIQGQPHWNPSSPGTLYTPNGTCIHRCWDYFTWRSSLLGSDQITTHCNVLQRTVTQCNALQHAATHYNTLNDDETFFDQIRVWHTTTHCSATWCSTLQHAATHCNTLNDDASCLDQTRRRIDIEGSSLVSRRRCTEQTNLF